MQCFISELHILIQTLVISAFFLVMCFLVGDVLIFVVVLSLPGILDLYSISVNPNQYHCARTWLGSEPALLVLPAGTTLSGAGDIILWCDAEPPFLAGVGLSGTGDITSFCSAKPSVYDHHLLEKNIGTYPIFEAPFGSRKSYWTWHPHWPRMRYHNKGILPFVRLWNVTPARLITDSRKAINREVIRTWRLSIMGLHIGIFGRAYTCRLGSMGSHIGPDRFHCE